MARQRLFLVDASGYVYRAFHALPALGTSRGLPTNAVLGFAKMLAKLLKAEKPEYLAIVFDAPGGTFRDALFAGYKEHRAPMPDELRPQQPYVRKLVAALRLPVVEEPGVEADDVIGTLVAQAEQAGLETVIVTADKDMMQLVSERTTLHDDMRNRRIGVPEVRERFGVEPALVPDVLGLMGDAIDNIPGVRGIGAKTAAQLLQRYGSLEKIYEHVPDMKRSRIRGEGSLGLKLEKDVANAGLSKRLATVATDTPIDVNPALLAYRGGYPAKAMVSIRRSSSSVSSKS
jgi:DNA polymerase I